MEKDRPNSKKGPADGTQQKKSHLPLYITAGVILCMVAASIVIPMLTNTNKDASDAYTAASDATAKAQVIEAGGSLIIPISDLSSTASFYPVDVDGTQMEIIAVKDSSGYVRTAFNTCQVCYSSGRGYYVQNGNALVCQNCGNRFTINQIEIESGGCNPWPIFEKDKTITDDAISISYDFLKESKNIFANWKIGY